MNHLKLRYAVTGGVWTIWVSCPKTGKHLYTGKGKSREDATSKAAEALGETAAPPKPVEPKERPKGKVLASTTPKTAPPKAKKPEKSEDDGGVTIELCDACVAGLKEAGDEDFVICDDCAKVADAAKAKKDAEKKSPKPAPPKAKAEK